MSWLRDATALIGLGMVLYGLSMWSAPLTVIAAGAVLVIGSLAWASIGGNRDS